MIKYFVLLTGLVVLNVAQRAPYAGSPNRSYLQVLPQYRPSVSSNNIDTNTEIINQRFGDNAGTILPPKYEPYDPFKDEQLIARIKTWPREKQPFWYLNSVAIAAQRGSGSPRSSTIPQRPSFAGRS